MIWTHVTEDVHIPGQLVPATKHTLAFKLFGGRYIVITWVWLA